MAGTPGARVGYLVVGLGAVGTTIAALLASTGVSVAGVARGARGCRLVEVAVEGLVAPREILVCGWDSAKSLEPRVVLFAVKAFQLEEALREAVLAEWSPELVVSLQNGLGSLERLEEVYGPERAGAAVVYIGATRLGDKVVYHGGKRVVVGCRHPPCSPLLARLAEDLSAAGLEAEYAGWIEPHRWLKLAVNAAINPVTLLAWSPNRVVVEDPDARLLAETLAEEAGEVARAHSIPLPGDPVEEAIRTARETAGNCSSTLQDAARHGATEIPYINGAVARKAEEKNMKAPYNHAVSLASILAAKTSKGRPLPCKQ